MPYRLHHQGLYAGRPHHWEPWPPWAACCTGASPVNNRGAPPLLHHTPAKAPPNYCARCPRLSLSSPTHYAALPCPQGKCSNQKPQVGEGSLETRAALAGRAIGGVVARGESEWPWINNLWAAWSPWAIVGQPWSVLWSDSLCYYKLLKVVFVSESFLYIPGLTESWADNLAFHKLDFSLS